MPPCYCQVILQRRHALIHFPSIRIPLTSASSSCATASCATASCATASCATASCATASQSRYVFAHIVLLARSLWQVMAALTANTCERTADVLLVFERPLAEEVQV